MTDQHKEQRSEPRMLCADLVEVRWTDPAGEDCEAVVNLEDISESGACFLADVEIPMHTVVHLRYPNGSATAAVRHGHWQDEGFFVGLQFEDGFKWSESGYTPQHLLDPRQVAGKPKTAQPADEREA